MQYSITWIYYNKFTHSTTDDVSSFWLLKIKFQHFEESVHTAGLSSTAGQQPGSQIWLVTETQWWRHTWGPNKTKNRVYKATTYVQIKMT